ncbi:MAG: DUF6220 domain-containing protein [Solirubrobacterales bacterium]
MNTARTAHRALVIAFAGGIVVQFFLAGVGVFGAASFDAHGMFGTLLTLVALLIVVTASIGRAEVKLSAGLFVLTFVQGILVPLGDVSPWIAALHPVNALALVAVTTLLVRRRAVGTDPAGPIPATERSYAAHPSEAA